MLIARLLLFFAIALVALSLIAYLISGNRRYLGFLKKVMIFAVVIFVAIFLFFIFERLVLVL
jgi:hypothetical protein